MKIVPSLRRKPQSSSAIVGFRHVLDPGFRRGDVLSFGSIRIPKRGFHDKYTHRPDIRDCAALEGNFRNHFEALNRVRLTDGEFKRLLDEIITPDVFTAATRLRVINSFTRDDGTPLNYTLVNIKDLCKNTFEVVNQLRINTDYSFQRHAAELAAVAGRHGLANKALQTFVDAILDRMIFDGEQFTDLMEPLELGWRKRREKELALMDDLVPLLKKRAGGRSISGLSAYEQ